METEPQGLYDTIDWARVYQSLWAVARGCTGRMPAIFDGISAEDLVGETLLIFFASKDGLGWSESEGPLHRFLAGVLKHKMLDQLRRQSKTAASFDDPNFARQSDNRVSGASPLQKDELKDQLCAVANGDKKLDDLIHAAEDIDGEHNINQELAEKLRTTPQDIVNRRRRFKRLLNKQSAKRVQ